MFCVCHWYICSMVCACQFVLYVWYVCLVCVLYVCWVHRFVCVVLCVVYYECDVYLMSVFASYFCDSCGVCVVWGCGVFVNVCALHVWLVPEYVWYALCGGAVCVEHIISICSMGSVVCVFVYV